MFPGQGSQYVGMGKQPVAEFPYASRVFEEAEDAAKLNIRNICFDGPEDDLKLTANTQPCIVTHSIAIWTVLKERLVLIRNILRDNSLGEYSALVAAGILSLSDAVSLVRKRGSDATGGACRVGAMAAVMQLPADELEKLCEEISTDDSKVEVANYNKPQQIVVAGHKEPVEELVAKAQELGKRFVLLLRVLPFTAA